MISFEPIRSVFQELLTAAKADADWEAHNCALGAASGEVTINVSDYSVFSSILNLTEAATEFNPRAAVSEIETVTMRTLDEVASMFSGNMLLKIDTQGYEKCILEGGQYTLTRVRGVFVELPIISLYQGIWKFHEAIEYMASKGFILAQIHPANFSSRDRVSLLEVDCLFRRCDH